MIRKYLLGCAAGLAIAGTALISGCGGSVNLLNVGPSSSVVKSADEAKRYTINFTKELGYNKVRFAVDNNTPPTPDNFDSIPEGQTPEQSLWYGGVTIEDLSDLTIPPSSRPKHTFMCYRAVRDNKGSDISDRFAYMFVEDKTKGIDYQLNTDRIRAIESNWSRAGRFQIRYVSESDYLSKTPEQFKKDLDSLLSTFGSRTAVYLGSTLGI